MGISVEANVLLLGKEAYKLVANHLAAGYCLAPTGFVRIELEGIPALRDELLEDGGVLLLYRSKRVTFYVRNITEAGAFVNAMRVLSIMGALK